MSSIEYQVKPVNLQEEASLLRVLCDPPPSHMNVLLDSLENPDLVDDRLKSAYGAYVNGNSWLECYE